MSKNPTETAVMEPEDVQAKNGRIMAEDDTMDDLTDIEVPPQDDWFFETPDPDGDTLVYLRFAITGWKTRRIGPFESREKALWALDGILMKFDETLCEEERKLREETVQFPLQNREQIIFLEDPYTFHPHFKKPKKGA